MPTYPHIQRYHEDLARLIEAGGSDRELNIRPAFQNCLAAYCDAHKEKLTLVPELRVGGVRPDGTVKDTLRMARGYWEAKDTGDNLDREIERKFNRGYPRDNIIFEDSQLAVLIQNNEVAMRANMQEPGELHQLIHRFLDYELPQIEEFRGAQAQFKADLPEVIANLREAVDAAEAENADFQATAASFLELCHASIGPDVTAADVREMLLQHILTKDIFLRVFAEDQFHRENNVARRLDHLERTFFTGEVRRQARDRLLTYYGAIGRAADEIADYAEKQQFLKAVYEDFYKAYNPAAADRLGVVYTPNEVVDFIIRGADHLLQKHFGRGLADDNVQILDPATGTGTFITSLIDYLPADRLEYKYRNEIHANEVAILPYYIANLNIEYAYKEKMGRYLEFPNLVFVDTLDNMGWQEQRAEVERDRGAAVETRQASFNLGGLSTENWMRVQLQNEKPISVIIGNPPYNDSATLWGDGGANRPYPEIDRRIRETYVEESTAQKTHQYDMYKRFIRWASDRLDDDGIIGFVTNRAYLDGRQDDGFRKVASREFTDIYVLDLASDVRRNPKISGTTHNVFGIQTGVAIGFFVRKKSKLGHCDIHYAYREDDELAVDKLAYLRNAMVSTIGFMEIEPDRRSDWLNQSEADFGRLIPLIDKQTKLAKTPLDERATFGMYSNGVKTNRDEWVYDFEAHNLRNKALFFADAYNGLLDMKDESFTPVIKWSRDLRNEFKRGRRIVYSDAKRIRALYRPYSMKEHFADFTMNDVLTKNHYAMFGSDLRHSNKVICFSGISSTKPFQVLATDKGPGFDLLEKTQCLPLYRYTPDGERVSNITDWGIKRINDHYRQEWGKHFEELAGGDSITAEDIFAYTYAVLHDPVYRHEYANDLLREFPRLPLYHTFDDFAHWGRELLDLHTGFESAEPFELGRRESRLAGDRPPKVILKADKEKGRIILDENTALVGVPDDAWRYKLGSRSALEWVLDQYKEKKPKDPTIREKFNTYRFADHKERVIDLLKRVCTVSVRTMEIVDGMAFWYGDHLVVLAERHKNEWTSMWVEHIPIVKDDEGWLAELENLPDIYGQEK